MSFEQLQRLARSGQLTPTDMVQEQGTTGWIAAASVPGLFISASSPPSSTAQKVPTAVVLTGGERSMPKVPGASPRQASFWQRSSTGTKAAILGGGAVVGVIFLCCGSLAVVGMKKTPESRSEDRTASNQSVTSNQQQPRAEDKKPEDKRTPTTTPPTKRTDPVGNEVYFPYTEGVSRHYQAAAFLPNGTNMARQCREDYEKGKILTVTTKIGVLQGTGLSRGTIRWTKQDQRITPDFPEHYRVTDEYVEIGQHLADNDTIFWEPVLKLNARKGDKWTWQVAGTTKQYELLELRDDSCFVQSTMQMPLGKMVSTRVYAKGEGLIAESVQVAGKKTSERIKADLKTDPNEPSPTTPTTPANPREPERVAITEPVLAPQLVAEIMGTFWTKASPSGAKYKGQTFDVIGRVKKVEGNRDIIVVTIHGGTHDGSFLTFRFDTSDEKALALEKAWPAKTRRPGKAQEPPPKIFLKIRATLTHVYRLSSDDCHLEFGKGQIVDANATEPSLPPARNDDVVTSPEVLVREFTKKSGNAFATDANPAGIVRVTAKIRRLNKTTFPSPFSSITLVRGPEQKMDVICLFEDFDRLTKAVPGNDEPVTIRGNARIAAGKAVFLDNCEIIAGK